MSYKKGLVPKDKHDVSHIDELHQLTDDEIAPIMPELLEWVQDINWPVALPIVGVLSEREELVFRLVMKVMRGDDEMWKYWINEYLVPSFTSGHQQEIKKIYINMEQVLEFLREHNEVSFATCEAGRPKVRVFQIMKIDGTTLYFTTSPSKEVYKQLRENPHIEILSSYDKVSVRCMGKASFDVDDQTKQWIYDNNPVLPRLYATYDELAYFSMAIDEMDYYDLSPTPPLFKHFDLVSQAVGKQIIDPVTWSRRQNFDFFRGFANPNIGITVRVDAGQAYRAAKTEGRSFFLRYFHALLSAANAIDEFHYRIDREGRIIRYDRIDGLAPIRVEGRGNFTELRFPFSEDFDTFYNAAKEIISHASDYDPYEQESGLTEFDLMLVSAVPGLDFSSICATQRDKHGNDYPLCTIGKMGHDNTMPIALTVHHGFIDGEHLTRFFGLVQDRLNGR